MTQANPRYRGSQTVETVIAADARPTDGRCAGPPSLHATEAASFRGTVGSALALERGDDARVGPAPLAGEPLRRAVTVNRLVPLIARWRDELVASLDDRDWLRRTEASGALRLLTMASTVADIQRTLDAADVRSLVLKGVPLGVRTTGSLTGRQFTDIDVLVDLPDLERAGQALDSAGVARAAPGQISPVRGPYHRWVRHTMNHLQYRSEGGVPIELHWRLSSLDRQLPIDFDTLWRRRVDAATGGASWHTLGAVDELLFVSVHAAKHSFSRLHWLVDVVRLLRSTPAATWHQVCGEAAELGAARALALAVRWAGVLEANGRTVPLGRRDERAVDALQARVRPGIGPPPRGFDHLWLDLRLHPDVRYALSAMGRTACPPGMVGAAAVPAPLAFVSLPVSRLRKLGDGRRRPVDDRPSSPPPPPPPRSTT